MSSIGSGNGVSQLSFGLFDASLFAGTLQWQFSCRCDSQLFIIRLLREVQFDYVFFCELDSTFTIDETIHVLVFNDVHKRARILYCDMICKEYL